jgi:four helix bundle protein
MGDFTKLDIWKLSHEIVLEVYKLIDRKSFKSDYDLKSQIRRAAISIPSNIAEGEESGFNKLGIRYFFNAKASIAEIRTQLLIARDINYISRDEYSNLDSKLNILSMKVRKLIEYRQKII